MASPVIWDAYDGLRLEGALQYAVVALESGSVPSDVFADAPRDIAVDIPIPIVDVEIGGRRIACASVALAPPCAIETVRFIRRRARVEALAVGKVLISGGPYKSTNIPKATVTTPWVDFFVRGDRARLATLLKDVSSLSASRAGGLGVVLGWQIDDDPDDRSLVYRDAPQRTLPLVSDGGEWDLQRFDPTTYEIREATTRAPYWHQRSRAECLTPVPRREAAAA